MAAGDLGNTSVEVFHPVGIQCLNSVDLNSLYKGKGQCHSHIYLNYLITKNVFLKGFFINLRWLDIADTT